jgi:hypothetical protein
MHVSGDYAYAHTYDTVVVINISDPAAPYFAGTIGPETYSGGVVTIGDLILLANRAGIIVVEAHFTCGPAQGDDPDHDAICGDDDNCPEVANWDQGDGDEDGVGNACDNCLAFANPGQSDADSDDLGDECDTVAAADFDGSDRVDGFDLVPFAFAFGSRCGDEQYSLRFDIEPRGTSECWIDGMDLVILAAYWAQIVP